MRNKVDWLYSLGVLEKIPFHVTSYSVLSLVQLKKDKTIQFLTDFRKINSQIKRNPYVLLLVNELIEDLHGFTFATTLDLNMGYYTICLAPKTQMICMTVLP